MKIFIIPGDPTPLARPRFYKKKIYDSQKNIKLIAGLHVQQQQNDDPLLEGALHLDITFFMKAPESISAKRRALLFATAHIFKPDLSNMIKFYEDICSNVVYHDDCIIAKISARKIYDEIPRTEFTLRVINEKEKS